MCMWGICVHMCVCVQGRCSTRVSVAQCSHTHTHINTHTALRKINQHFIYPFASWICTHPHSQPPQSFLIPGSKEYRRKGRKECEIRTRWLSFTSLWTYFKNDQVSSSVNIQLKLPAIGCCIADIQFINKWGGWEFCKRKKEFDKSPGSEAAGVWDKS